MTDASKETEELTQTAECKQHGKYGSKGFQLPFRNKRIVWRACPDCTKEENEIKEKEEVKARQLARAENWRRKLLAAGVPVRFFGKSFDDFNTESKMMVDARESTMSFANHFSHHLKNGSSLVLSGIPGTGKSHLALAVLQTILQSGYSGVYVNVLDAIRTVRETWQPGSRKTENDVLDRFGNVDLLVLDELGVQYGTDSEQMTIFDILNRRYRNMKPSVVLTNLDRDGLQTYLGERSFDRLRETGQWVAFDWESWRPKQKLNLA